MPTRPTEDLDQLVRALRDARTDLGSLLESELVRRVRALCSQQLGPGDRLRGAMDSEDLSQDVLLDLIDVIEQFRGTTWAEFYAFVDALVGRRKVQHARRLGAAKRGGFPQEREPIAESSAKHTGTPSRVASGAEEREKARRLLELLPEEDQLPIRWRLLDGLSYAEIAAKLGLTESAVRQRVSRGLRRLKERW